jgi:uncharacterized LabA/DUF88 family protein
VTALQRQVRRWEEKETDVAIGARLLELICKDMCDTAVLVTGDTDLVPAIRAARRLDPAKDIVALQPYRRVNRELSRCADRALTIRVASYARHQLPLAAPESDGSLVSRPTEWN